VFWERFALHGRGDAGNNVTKVSMRPKIFAIGLALSLTSACDKHEEAPEVKKVEVVEVEAKTQAPEPVPTPVAAADPGLVIVDSDQPVAATVERLRGDIEAKGLKVMAVIDHAANAAGAGLELPPTQVIIFGKPEVGTKLMQAKRTIAIDLPQKMLVWEENGQTKIAFNDPKWLLARHGATGLPPAMPTKIRGLLDSLATGSKAEKPAG